MVNLAKFLRACLHTPSHHRVSSYTVLATPVSPMTQHTATYFPLPPSHPHVAHISPSSMSCLHALSFMFAYTLAPPREFIHRARHSRLPHDTAHRNLLHPTAQSPPCFPHHAATNVMLPRPLLAARLQPQHPPTLLQCSLPPARLGPPCSYCTLPARYLSTPPARLELWTPSHPATSSTAPPQPLTVQHAATYLTPLARHSQLSRGALPPT